MSKPGPNPNCPPLIVYFADRSAFVSYYRTVRRATADAVSQWQAANPGKTTPEVSRVCC